MSVVSYDKDNVDYLSNDSVVQYKGLCSLIIMLYHLAWALDFTTYRPFSHGDLMTALFYFFSGYGLMKRFLETENYSKGFIRKRILPLLAVYGIVNVFYWLFYFSKGIVYTPYILFCNFIYYGKMLVNYSWFIVSIVVFYLFFYLLIRLFNNKTKHYGIFMICISFVFLLLYTIVLYKINWGMHWYTATPLFVNGIVWAVFEKKLLPRVRKYYWVLFLVFLTLFACSVYLNDFVFLTGKKHILVTIINYILVTGLFVLGVMKIKCSSRALYKIGKISLEIYLVHGFYIMLLTYVGIREYKIISYLFVIILTLISAFYLSKIKNRFFSFQSKS